MTVGEFDIRKNPRLTGYDYCQTGWYFITICTEKRKCILSHIPVVEQMLAVAEVVLTDTGKIAEKQLLAIDERYPFVKVEKYVIMPNHIHALISITEETAAASGRPTLSDIVRAYKSICSREWNRMQGTTGEKLFQTSFYDHIIRNQFDYDEIWNYIDTNPLKWKLDALFQDT